jgi:hypothetical protein
MKISFKRMLASCASFALLSFFALAMFLPVLSPSTVEAQNCPPGDTDPECIPTEFRTPGGFPAPASNSFTPTSAGSGRCEPGKLCNPLISSDISVIVITILKTVAQLGFAVAAIFLVYSGFLFITAQGDTTKLEKARSNFLWTVIGLGIFLGAWAIAIIIRNTIRQVAPDII